MNKCIVLVFFLVLLISCDIFAQKYNIKKYTVNDGLPIHEVYDVYADKYGYLWFETYSNGLIRYNGYDYKIFGANVGLKGNIIFDLHVENDQNFWVSTETGGLAKFDGKKFTYFPELELLDTMLVKSINSVLSDELWIGTESHGIAIWDQKTNEIEFFTENDGLPSNSILDINFSSENEIWITTLHGVVLFDRETKISEIFTIDDGFSGKEMYETAIDNIGRKWVATSDGIVLIQPDGTIDYISEIGGENIGTAISIEVDDEGTIWVGTLLNGLFLIYHDGTSIKIEEKNGLSSNFVNQIVKDVDGTIWVATTGGVSVFKDLSITRYDMGSKLEANRVFALKKAKNNTIWLTTENGLSKYVDEKFVHFKVPDSLLHPNDQILDIEELPNGNLLLGSIFYEMLEFDGEKFFHTKHHDEMLPVYVNDILVDIDESIWYASEGQLSHQKNDEIIHHKIQKEGYSETDLIKLYQDSRNILWIGTMNGLARFENGKFEFFNEEPGILGKEVSVIVEDSQKNIWIGTNKGIAYLLEDSIKSGNIEFNLFTPSELFIQESVFLMFDSNGGFWQGTNHGLNYFDLKDWDFKSEPTHFYLPILDNGRAVELNGAANIEDNDGILWFGTYSHGLIRLNYKDRKIIKSNSKVFLRQILANFDTVYTQDMTVNSINNLEIDYDKNDLTFYFNAVNFLNTEDVSIRYRLAGYDKNWKNTININELRYTNLPPGNYSLKVETKSIQSEWSETQNLISFTILKPFYLRFDFIVLISILTGFLFYAIFRFLVIRIEKRKLQKIVEQRTEELTSALNEKEVLLKEIHHRVKNNLAVVSGLLQLQASKMSENSAKTAIYESQMRIIAMSKIHENLYKNNDLARVDFRKFIIELINSIKATMDLEDKHIEVTHDILPVHMDVNVGIPLGLTINELISNSYKHAFIKKHEGRIFISFKEIGNNFELIVSDNGIGASKDLLKKNYESLGITLIKSLTKQINGKLRYSNDEGASFKLLIPKEQEGKSLN